MCNDQNMSLLAHKSQNGFTHLIFKHNNRQNSNTSLLDIVYFINEYLTENDLRYVQNIPQQIYDETYTAIINNTTIPVNQNKRNGRATPRKSISVNYSQNEK